MLIVVILCKRRKPPRGAGMAQWRSRSPPTNEARVDSQTRCHKWVELVVGARPCSEDFSPGSPVFLTPQESTFLNPIRSGIREPRVCQWSVMCNPRKNKVD